MNIQHITINLAPGKTRHDRMEGRDYLVAPMVMLTEGVHAGSTGPMYYPGAELAKTPMVWNHKPVVVYHPEINGHGVSACDPEVIDAYKIGIVMNASWDAKAAKLRAEAWIEVDRANKVDPRIMVAVDNNEPMELSTGLFSDHDPQPGVWNDEEYGAVARNYRPDHLALLPDRKGACSMADGAGFLVCNALSHEDTRSSLYTGLREKLGDIDFWIADVFASSVIYEHSTKLWKLMYTAANDVATLVDSEPVQVHRNVQYRTVDGSIVGNADYPLTTRPTGEVTMNVTKEEAVRSLIANESTNWAEEDKDGLLAMNEDQLAKMLPKAEEAPAAPDANTAPVPTPVPLTVENAAQVGGAGVAGPAGEAVLQPITLAQMPQDMQDVYNHGLATLRAERASLTATITANEGNTFTPEALAGCTIEQLHGMVGLCAKPVTEPAVLQRPPSLFGGAAAASPNTNEDAMVEPLGLPTMNFEKEAAKAKA